MDSEKKNNNLEENQENQDNQKNNLYSKIVDIAFKIYKELGPGYKEHIYVNAMIVELRKLNYSFASEVIIPIMYDGVQLGYERADIVIYEPEKYILEFKAMNSSLTKKENVQLEKYLKNLQFDTGIILNFGNNLEINKILNITL